VYTPHGYSSEGPPLPLLLLFDEPQYLTIIGAPITLDNLIAAGRIPPLVAVLISTIDPSTRSRELACNPAFADFLDEELLPWVRQRYHVTSEARDVTVGGASYGGLAAVYASLRHPESFGNVLCQSGSFWWAPVGDSGELSIRYGDREPNWLARQFITASKHPQRFFIEAGLFENDVWGTGGRILETSRQMRDVLRARGYEVHYQEFAGGHNLLNWRGSLADGLLALLGVAPEQR
jgi:enterochelin esterase family protein